MSDNGKGSKRRPAAIPQQTFLRNFERTFGPRAGESPDGGGGSPAAGSGDAGDAGRHTLPAGER